MQHAHLIMLKFRHIGRLYPFIFILFGSLAWSSTVRAELLVQLTTPRAAAGDAVTLRGVWLGADRTSAAPQHTVLVGFWQDAQGRQYAARFTPESGVAASGAADAAPAELAWVGHVPLESRGLLALQLDQAPDALLALRVEGPHGGAGARANSPKAHGGLDHDAGQGIQIGQANTPSQPTDVNRTASTISPFQHFRNSLSAYEPIYFAVGRNGGATARFQISFKYRPFSPVDAAHPKFINDWYVGYTQTTLWDLHSASIPFIDTTYNPSLFWARESLWQSRDQRRWFGLNTGVEHRSNGKGGDDSRSLNDFYLQPEFSTRLGSGSTLSFKPRLKYYVATDHAMDYPDYMGYVDWKLAWAQDNGLGLSALYRRGVHGGHNTTQVEATWPLQRTFLHMNGYLYLQYFRGYGETLLGYDQKSGPQLRLGIALVP